MTDMPDLGFINAPLDRAASWRRDPEWLKQKISDPQSKIIVFIDDRPAISVAGATAAIAFNNPAGVLQLQEQVEEQAEEQASFVLLHLTADNEAVFAVRLDEACRDQIVSENVKLIDLRSLAVQAILPPEDLGALAQARSLLGWHALHRFCAHCGDKTVLADAGYRRDCPSCKRQHFPRVDPVVIMLVQHGNRFLMGRGHNFEENHFSALAGFIEPGETIEAATRRETFEETGIKVGKVTYLTSQPWPFPSSLMIGVIAQATTTQISLDTDEIAEARWFSFKEIRQMLANNHPDGTTLPPAMSIAFQMMKKQLGAQVNQNDFSD